jgi:ribosomal protein S18 acetylase RimI-like enzyme
MTAEIELRIATLDDVDVLFPRTRALNDHEGIQISDAALDAALRQLLDDASIGCAWLIERDGTVVGYAIVTYGFDLEFAGREGWLTELWVDPDQRRGGVATAALALLAAELRARDVHAMHLQVRPDNAAVRVYERAGFETVRRLVLTRRL